ncbi:nuclear transport factor 2 family protein [Aureibaculum algae]|uniref:Nuclear transport factor 2 family protein n=1 Tax=Aureibaculum algae TaxID=2584122 RepID=A0A5B7TQB7_9FLAO|nr:nuclear transport factor 2 family protein [Aureibaculum algae]QCX38460.1 nuclear transport factor 2 family protein [Aureibaculum algae]
MKNFKTMMVLAIVLMLNPIVTNAQKSTIEFENADSAKNLVQTYVNALQAADIAKMSATLDSNAMIYGLGGGLDSLTVAEHTIYYKKSTDSYKHAISGDLYLPIKVTDNWNKGEWVLVWGTNTITNKETENTIVIPFHIASLVANGKIIMMRYFYDTGNIMKNTGWTLTPPKK